MDASKTKKEASEVKIKKSFFYVSGFHLRILLTNAGSIANFNFSCQYFFCKCPAEYDVNLSTGLGHPDGCFNCAGFFCWKEEVCRAPMAGQKKDLDTKNSIRYGHLRRRGKITKDGSVAHYFSGSYYYYWYYFYATSPPGVR